MHTYGTYCCVPCSRMANCVTTAQLHEHLISKTFINLSLAVYEGASKQVWRAVVVYDYMAAL